jgi:hypothetical protein
MAERRMCSRLRIGSASIPRSPSRPVTVLWIRSRKASGVVDQRLRWGVEGAEDGHRRPAALPGV